MRVSKVVGLALEAKGPHHLTVRTHIRCLFSDSHSHLSTSSTGVGIIIIIIIVVVVVVVVVVSNIIRHKPWY